MSPTLAIASLRLPELPHRLRRRSCAWIALILLAFNIVAGFGLRAAPLPAGLGEQIICTAAGIVIVHEDGQSGTAAASGDGFCLYCLPLYHATGPAAQAFAVSGACIRTVSTLQPIDVAPLHPARAHSVAAPRAPPQV